MKKKIALSDLPKEWKDVLFNGLPVEMVRDGEIVNEYPNGMDNGGSIPEFLKMIGISRKNHATLVADSEEYDSAIDIGRLHCEAWWKQFGRLSLKGEKVNQGLFSMYMKNMFGWRDSPLAKETSDTIIKDLTKDAELDARFKVKSEEKEETLN